jgi:hypothetical protein
MGAMATSVSDRVRTERRAAFVGRTNELRELLGLAEEDGPVVTFVHGLGGIGKTALVHALRANLEERGLRVHLLDGRAIEPTPGGVLAALGSALGEELPTPERAVRALEGLGRRVVLAVDPCDGLLLVDGWLRHRLVPALPASTRVLLVGRKAPASGWTEDPGWRALVKVCRLGPLPDADAASLMTRAGLDGAGAARVLAFARGHPLAILLGASALRERPSLRFEELERGPVIEALVRVHLEQVHDAALREVVEAACVVRRATRTILAALLGEPAAGPALERLASLPFVETAADGLVVDTTVRAAVAARLRAADPARHHALRQAAWSAVCGELDGAGRAERWRYTADLLYLADQPEVREAFFPSDAVAHSVEEARPADRNAVLEISERHDGAAGATIVRAWWRAAPGGVHVVRDRSGACTGFYVLAADEVLTDDLCDADPVAAAWRRHLTEHPLPRGQCALLVRRTLASETGEAPSETRAATWLDAKRAYLERPGTGRVYVATRAGEEMLTAVAKLGFDRAPALAVELDGRRTDTLILEMGAGGVLGWMARLVGASVARVESWRLDDEQRALIIDGDWVALTRLEYRVLAYLRRRGPVVVARDELLREVWQQTFGGSNVVDAVVRTVRRKLGRYAAALETVKGFGYRLRATNAAA